MRILVAGLGVSVLIATALPAQRNRRSQDPDKVWKWFADRNDANKDGKVTKDEYKRGADKFATFDRNADGVVTKDDFSAPRRRRMRGSRNPRSNQRARAPRPQPPKVGQPAPAFDLPLVKNMKKTISLASFKGKKPVALIFGSYT